MRPTEFSADTIAALLRNQTIASLAEVMAALGRVRLFFVGHPGGFCERHGKSYLTRRRRGEEGGGGGSVTGGTVPSV